MNMKIKRHIGDEKSVKEKGGFKTCVILLRYSWRDFKRNYIGAV
jgi:hypothetical protein